MTHTLTLWTNDPVRAAWADRAGVERIGVDLETMGKAARQHGLGTWVSGHTPADLDRIRPSVARAALFVRMNPFHDGCRAEVEALLGQGVSVLMLPNFTHLDEIASIVKIVAGRALVVPLVERVAAIESVEAMPQLGIDEIHVGLNDLSIDLGLTNRLAVLATGFIDELASAARAAGLRFGLGGLARALDAELPVPSDLVYAQHARLGASGALIARSFFGVDRVSASSFTREIARLRDRLDDWFGASPRELCAARNELQRVAAARQPCKRV